MDPLLFEERLSILERASKDVLQILGADYRNFTSNITQSVYEIIHTDPVLARPILKQHGIQLIYNTLILQDGVRQPWISELETGYGTVPVSEDLKIKLCLNQIYTDNFERVNKELMATENYTHITAENKSIKDLFSNAIYNGATDMPFTSSRDFVNVELYKHKTLNLFILVSNYVLRKRYQNKVGLLNIGDRPVDSNMLILLGIAPALVEEIKSILTKDETEFFKLLITPTKLYHEEGSKELYNNIILSETYTTLLRKVRVEELKKFFKKQEIKTFTNAIQNAQHHVDSVVNDLINAERNLLDVQKDYTYYLAGDSKFENAVDYIFNHAYMVNVSNDSNYVTCTFRVPLAQWDPELAETLLSALKKNPSRYEINSDYLEDIKHFLKYILIDQVAKYWILAEFRIELNTFVWQPVKVYWNMAGSQSTFRDAKLITYKAGLNPHMEYHSCTGSYSAQISKAQQRKDLPGMIEAILAPYKCWNLTDGIVQGKMFKYALPNLISYNIPCIEYKGEVITIRELHKRIEAEKTPVVEAPIKKKRAPKARTLENTTTEIDLADQIVADFVAAATINVDRARTFNGANLDRPVTDEELETELRNQAEGQAEYEAEIGDGIEN